MTPTTLPTGRESTRAFLWSELRPKGRLLTPFNVVSGLLVAAAAVILVARFAFGLGAVTNLSQDFPWGIWKGFNVVTGVAFAGGAYVVCFLVYIMGIEKYRPIVRVTVLNGFLAYCFYAGALFLELGRPWNILNPILGNEFGLTSVLFLVSWHFLLYISAQFVELSPAAAEWLGWRRVHRFLSAMTVGAVVFGITLSTLHQSGLGALYLMAPTKIHPLWYTEFLPLLFFVSSVFAGLALVILEGTLSRRVFFDRMDPKLQNSHDEILTGLARISGGTMFAYLFLQIVAVVHGRRWDELSGGWGLWYLLEVVGLVAVPMVMFIWASRRRRLGWIRGAAVLTLLGVVLNRLNVSLIAFRWDAVDHYVPTWMEVVVSASILCVEVWVFRWVVYRLPILGHRPAWARAGSAPRPITPPRERLAA